MFSTMAIDPICGMHVDENTGFKYNHNGVDVYFCSTNCFEKYKKEHGISDSEICETCAIKTRQPFYKNKILIIVFIIIVSYILGLYIPQLEKLQMVLRMYLQKIALPVGLGLFLGGIIDWLVPREYVSKMLSGTKKRTIFGAVVTGFLMSVCSHGILALAIQLYKKGASAPAVVAFLLASPWANLPMTILMFGFFGIKALAIILSAIVIAIISGFIFLFLSKLQLIETNPNTITIEEGFSIRKDIRKRISEIRFSFDRFKKSIKAIWDGSISLANMVLWWILLGAFLSSLAGAFIPETFMKAYMGASILGLLATLLIATVLEVCSEGTAPLAFEIYRQTGALGNAFVFLMAGVVTDYTEIGLLWTNVGKKTAIWLPVVTVPMVILLGIVFNIIL
ncbi:permease [Candidatus Margulisiibacteriota bacterium]